VKLVIAAVGRAKEPEVRALLEGYYGRIRRYAELDEVEIRDERPDHAARAFERALAAQGARGELVTLEIDARPLSSEALAARVGDAMERAVVPVFAIGGADGLPAELRARARWRLSFGPMTLPHRLARIVLAEQLYRAFTILRGEPYHHG
jgi:23S rRNA (pseudouridine1915-N3)-methyltransferase